MADEEERVKAEKLAAARKRVAQLQKQKKKTGKKGSTADSSKDVTDSPKDDSASAAGPAEDVPSDSAPAQKEQDATGAAEEKPAEPEQEPEPEPQRETEPQPGPEKLEKPGEHVDSLVEPMPDAPTELPTETAPEGNNNRPDTPRSVHGHRPSLSAQSKLRSTSFRRTSASQGNSPSPLSASKVPSLPPLTADEESVHEVFRKHSMRVEELEKDKKRLEKEVEEENSRRKSIEDQLQEFREASMDTSELKDRLDRAEKKAEEIEELKAEIASLQRQNSHLQTKSHRSTSTSTPNTSESPPSDLVQQLDSKSATIEAMELEISNLRAQLTSQSSSSNAHETQIAALQEKLSQHESSLERAQQELADTKHALTRASEKAVKDGVDKTSTETLIKTLQREMEELKHEKAEADKKTDTLEKKLQALGNLHKESETRHQTKARETEKTEKEAAALRKRLASIENDNLRLREERDRTAKRDASGGADDDALDELEDEGRSRLERRIRELEGEVFDLRRGAWKEQRQGLAGSSQPQPHPQPHQSQDGSIIPPENGSPSANAFDDVELVGGTSDHGRRSVSQRPQHTSLSTVLSSGLAAFTGGSGLVRPPSAASASSRPQAPRGSLELLSEENLEDEFDEAEFARAQAEEEGRKRVEWAREIKSKLNDWKGWRLDLVDSRAGAEGAGVGMGEIFEV